MSIFVYLSALLAMANCAGMLYSGFGILHMILFLVALLMAILGILIPGPDKTDGRVVSILAIILAVLPLAREPIRTLRTNMKARAYAKEIAPLATEWKSTREEFAGQVAGWETRFQVPPAFDGATVRPPPTPLPSSPPSAPGYPAPGAPGVPAFMGGQNPPGQQPAGTFPSLSLPVDPFNTEGEPCRYWTNDRNRWILLSKGPDKAADLQLPPEFRPTDRADGRGRWIYVNKWNIADLLYDPTNGSLGKGDLLWVDGSGEATTAYTEAMTGAWSRASAAIAGARGGGTECQRAGAAARKLLDQGDTLAALAAGTESFRHIPPYPAQQKLPDFVGRLVQGEALYALGDPRMAAEALASYVELNPNDPGGHYHLAAALYFSGDVDQARREFAAASQIDQAHPLARPAYDALVAISQHTAPPLVPPGSAVKEQEQK